MKKIEFNLLVLNIYLLPCPLSKITKIDQKIYEMKIPPLNLRIITRAWIRAMFHVGMGCFWFFKIIIILFGGKWVCGTLCACLTYIRGDCHCTRVLTTRFYLYLSGFWHRQLFHIEFFFSFHFYFLWFFFFFLVLLVRFCPQVCQFFFFLVMLMLLLLLSFYV